MLVFSAALAAWPQCGAPRLESTPDFAWLVGRAPQLFLLYADDSTRTPAGAVPLAAADKPFVRMRSASRHNDGSAAESVTLEPMDGILLRR